MRIRWQRAASRRSRAALHPAPLLRNIHNKKELIRFLQSRLDAEGICSTQATGDADSLIVSIAITAAKEGKRTVVISVDTDIVIMLCYHRCAAMADIFFQTSRKIPVVPKEGATAAQIKKATAKSKQKPIPMWWNISKLKTSYRTIIGELLTLTQGDQLFSEF